MASCRDLPNCALLFFFGRAGRAGGQNLGLIDMRDARRRSLKETRLCCPRRRKPLLPDFR